MVIKGIAKGDKDLRHFTFDDGDYIVRGGVYYYKVNYGKNKLEGEYGEDEINYVECSKVIPLGGKKPKPIPGLEKKSSEPVTLGPVQEETPKKRGRKAKVEDAGSEVPSLGDMILPDKFEYEVCQFNYSSVSELNESLNKMGLQGWEMCGFSPYKPFFEDPYIIAVFKRKRG